MCYEFKTGLNAYFAALGPAAPLKSLKDLIAFNERHAEQELALFGQETLLESESKGPLTESGYVEARARCVQWSQRLDAVFEEHRLDAVVVPTCGPAHRLDWLFGDRSLGGTSTYGAVSGFPNITVPCGMIGGLPLGMSFFGRAWSEPRLLSIAYSFEQATKARKAPSFLPSVDLA
jgi:amidase